jgi:hypothetical protein
VTSNRVSGRRPEGSDASGPAVADGDLVPLDDDRHVSLALRELHHLVEPRLVREDVDVLDFVVLVGVGLTGRRRVGSGVLAEDPDDFVGHRVTSREKTW